MDDKNCRVFFSMKMHMFWDFFSKSMLILVLVFYRWDTLARNMDPAKQVDGHLDMLHGLFSHFIPSISRGMNLDPRV